MGARASGRIRVIPARQENWVVVAVNGEVDLLTADQFEAEIIDVVDDSHAGLAVDLSDTTFFGAAGMRVLRRVQQGLPAETLFAVVATEAIARHLRITGMDSEMSIHPTVDLALQAVGDAGEDRAAS